VLPIPLSRAKCIYLYPKPININWGEKKLTEICKQEMGIDPTHEDLFVFFNKDKDKLKLFHVDATGSQEIIKILPTGEFMIPVATQDEKYISLELTKLKSLFKLDPVPNLT
jgi:hypothetical protein